MSIKEKAIAKIAAQLSALIGDDNFKIVDGEQSFGSYTDTPALPKRTSQKQFHFRDTEVYPKIEALKPGESVTLPLMSGVPTKNLQSVAASICLRLYGKGNTMTSRRPDGGIDVLRLS